MNKNEKNLVEGNLINMYRISKEWIDELEFYELELNFFNNLISERIASNTHKDLSHKDIYRNIDDLLFKLSNNLISEIKTHRKELVQLIDSNNFSQNSEESKIHLHLLEKMFRVKDGIKKLKKALFIYIKDNPFDFEFDTILNDL
ncbi:hypothetical protein [Bizionia arctica]|uniref:Uncharacterized protein n=1 Tax=Bizionia arctica TaxID=1495645 RepID=A0A917LK87_9FLAO|nr:hypothetical protein [Bizionia arctica]GGG37148.1 hypothetical protein GCM10010976_06040 [Bizionia arctica]